TMMAVGMRRSRISILFLLEAAVLAALAGAAGVLAARGVILLVNHLGGIPIAAPGQTELRYHLLLAPLPAMVRAAVVFSFIGAIVAALYPAWEASRLRPVDALRAI